MTTINKKEECENKESHIWDDKTNTCIRNIDTVDMFLKKPLVGSLAIALFAYICAAFLYKIKGTPLAKSNEFDKTYGKFITCAGINLDKLLFRKNISLGVVQEEAYKPAKQNKYGKIFFPWLSQYIYPHKPNEGPNKHIDTFYVLMAPLFFTFKWSTKMYYSIFSAVKKLFYKADHWGSLSEIDKINKKLWLSDFLAVFIVIPLLITMVFPLAFVFLSISSIVLSPFMAMLWNYNSSDKLRPPSANQDTRWPIMWKIARFFKMFGWLILHLFMGFVGSFFLIMSHFLWIGSIFTGSQEKEADGMKTIIRTWANIIWDYKFIWAILAGTLWLSNFRMFLSGSFKQDISYLDFITPENQEMMLGIVGGALVILLSLQQSKYYKSLSSSKPQSRSCGNCAAPPAGDDDVVSGKKKKCLNPDYDPKNKKWRKGMSSAWSTTSRLSNPASIAIGNTINKSRPKFSVSKTQDQLNKESLNKQLLQQKKSLNNST